MEPTLSNEVDVSILLPTPDGHSEGSVTGEVGALSSPNLTIVKYLISWNDNPLELHEDFLDPNHAPAI